ncbi:glycosyltransferase [Litoreibacter janthinus]|uniref:Glycosyltransferase subfamily 4-like N-terminal domain-containing protein n=1 Tax=Litoreibacter janthinus TaxID=670154 RepID=A0A1I6IDB5_9RHOB|nr:glycosyltransferase [Litoreibacter janthinus]SFR64614.1 hypothetical protein SAMN04488002_3708 [Litoreibacter janthinus]
MSINTENKRDPASGRIDILHLTSAHPVSDTRIFVKEARALADAGYRVAVAGPGDITGHQTKDHVQVFTLARPKGRLARFTSFARSLYRFSVDMSPRVVHIHDPDLLLLAWFLKRHGIKTVYDVHEEFPKAILSRAWLGPLIIRRVAAQLVDRLERSAAGWLDGIVLADKQLADRFPQDRSVVTRNYLDMSEWPTTLPAPKEITPPLRCIYVGDISEARGLTRMCDAIHEANEAGIEATLELVGRISDTQRDTISNHPSARHIIQHGWGTRSEVASKLATSDIAFCLLEPTPAYREALPVKVLEYIVSGLQVIATDLPRLRSETLLNGAIHFVPWDAPKGALGAAIGKAKTTDRARQEQLQQVVIDHYNWANEAARLNDFYDRLLSDKASKEADSNE